MSGINLSRLIALGFARLTGQQRAAGASGAVGALENGTLVMPNGDAVDPVKSVAGLVGDVILRKNDVGLGSADNTADEDKPVSAAQALALANKLDVHNPAFTGDWTGGAGGTVNLGAGQLIKDLSGNLLLGGNVEYGSGIKNVVADGSGGAAFVAVFNGGANRAIYAMDAIACRLGTNTNHPIIFRINGNECGGVDVNQNLMAGVVSASCHTLEKTPGNGNQILKITQQQATVIPVAVYQVDYDGIDGANGANAAFKTGKSGTGRSINTSGTVNASGADYAEYEQNNGLKITKGSIVGFKPDGTLTLTYAEAVRFAIKSTDPSYVGGDVWGSEAEVGKRPDVPVFVPPAYTGHQAPGEEPQPGPDADAAAREAHTQLHAQYLLDKATYDAALDAHACALSAAQIEFDWVTVPAYQGELAAFEARLDAARQLVDRIAYSGKVPCNVLDATPGDYIVAVAAEDGAITGVSVPEPNFPQYRRAVGRVNRLLSDGRCEVAVIMH